MRTPLGVAGQIKLAKYIEAQYVASGLTDATFANKAKEELGFVKLSYEQVRRVRDALGIPQNRPAAQSLTIVQRLEALETQVAELRGVLLAEFPK